jgi:hypothetical protein
MYADTAQRILRYITENTQTLHRKAQKHHSKYIGTTQRMHGHGTEYREYTNTS